MQARDAAADAEAAGSHEVNRARRRTAAERGAARRRRQEERERAAAAARLQKEAEDVAAETVDMVLGAAVDASEARAVSAELHHHMNLLDMGARALRDGLQHPLRQVREEAATVLARLIDTEFPDLFAVLRQVCSVTQWDMPSTILECGGLHTRKVQAHTKRLPRSAATKQILSPYIIMAGGLSEFSLKPFVCY